MATTYTLNSQSYGERKLSLTCTQVKDNTNNKSTINWVLTVSGNSSASITTGPTKVYIDGNLVYSAERIGYTSRVFPAIVGSTSGSITVNHALDGKKTINLSLSTAIYSAQVQTVSGSWVLDATSRGAIITDAPNFNDEENPTIKYTNYGGSRVTTLQACISLDNGASATIPYRDISKTGTSYTFNLTTEERNIIYSNTTTTNTVNAKFYIKSVVDGLTFYSTKTKVLTIVNNNPTLSTTVTSNSSSLTGDNDTFIKGLSNATYSITATPLKSATITSTKITAGSKSATTTTGTINAVETGTFVITATDSRGNTTTQTISKTLVNYIPLTCNFSCSKISATGTATLNISGKWFNNKFGSNANAVQNTITVAYKYKTESTSYTSWINVPVTISNDTYSATVNLTGLDYREIYTFQVRATDEASTVLAPEQTVKSIPCFYWNDTDFYFNTNVFLKGSQVAMDGIIEQGKTTTGETTWYYRKWANGYLECDGITTTTTGSFSASNNLYISPNLTVGDYPVAYYELPNITASCTGASGWILQRDKGTVSAAPTVAILRTYLGSSETATIYTQARGRWKQ